jgi:hypothetical protein
MYGIKVNKKIMDGKIAIIKLYDNEDALFTNDSF